MVAPQAAKARVQLIEKLEGDLPLIRADERRLKQVLVNLLGNAVKFTRPGGHIEVKLAREGDGLVLVVRDTGIGMAQEDIPVARERFGQVESTLSRKYEGAGLGLPISIQIVELHGGRLDIQSALGIGTTVTVYLPGERLVSRSERIAAA